MWTVLRMFSAAWIASPSASAAGQAYVYVATSYDDTLVVVDTAPNAPVKTIPSHGYPLAVAVSRDGALTYVANVDSSTITMIDTATNAVIGSIILPAHTYPNDVAVAPDGSRVYAVSPGNRSPSIPGMLFVIDSLSRTVLQTLSLPDDFPVAIEISPDGAFAYVTNAGSDSVSVVDTAANSIAAKIPVGHNPFAIAMTPDGARAYVANYV
jgi:YVTN family beta-propeller protein